MRLGDTGRQSQLDKADTQRPLIGVGGILQCGSEEGRRDKDDFRCAIDLQLGNLERYPEAITLGRSMQLGRHPLPINVAGDFGDRCNARIIEQAQLASTGSFAVDVYKETEFSFRACPSECRAIRLNFQPMEAVGGVAQHPGRNNHACHERWRQFALQGKRKVEKRPKEIDRTFEIGQSLADAEDYRRDAVSLFN
jgi:hypothetical protein